MNMHTAQQQQQQQQHMLRLVAQLLINNQAIDWLDRPAIINHTLMTVLAQRPVRCLSLLFCGLNSSNRQQATTAATAAAATKSNGCKPFCRH